MSSMEYRKNTNNDERGFASITIALVIVLVLSLITVGFAQLARREQQSALNKQLASQAQYAAESGINDVIRKIQTNSSAIGNSPEACLAPRVISPSGTDDNYNVVAGDRDVTYTCALADLNPDSLGKDLDADSSWRTTFSTDQSLGNLQISWKTNSGQPRTPKSVTPGEFTSASTWGDHPAVLQVNITPFSTESISRDDLIEKSFTVYLYPSSGGTNTVTYQTYGPTGAPAANQGKIVSGSCNATADDCSATISGLAGKGPYLLHIIDYYDPSTIAVKGTTSGGDDVNFVNAQAKVDVTGKARNVLKRLQVRVPLSPAYPLPDYALEAQNICKRQETEPGVTNYVKKLGGAANSGDPCFLND